MKRASIDIGSNSVLLLAAEIENGRIKNELLDESAITSLGKDLDKSKAFHPDSMSATYQTLVQYKKLCEQNNIKTEDVIVTATEASRVATNAPDFYKKIKNDLGFTTEIITSEGEAYYTALGVVSSLKNSSATVVVMDMGGASTELIKINQSPFSIQSSVSLPVGSVRSMDWQKSGVFDENIKKLLNTDLKSYETDELICVAGSMTALAAMYLGLKEFEASKIEGMTISFSNFKAFTNDLQNTSLENLNLLFPFLGKRAPMISAGALAALKIAEKINIHTLKISTRGLRYGTLLSGRIDEQFSCR